MSESSSLKQAIYAAINDAEARTDVDACSFGDLVRLEREFGGSAFREVLALIDEGRAYVPVPLSLADFDTPIAPIDWQVGRSTRDDIIKRFGEPHLELGSAAGRTYFYDIYVENVDDDYPPPPERYQDRNQADTDRPADCTFPYAPIWPPEALQVEFGFDQMDVLTTYGFKVADRLT